MHLKSYNVLNNKKIITCMYVFNILNTRIKILLYWVGGGGSCNFISIEKLILWVSFLLPVSTKFSNCVNIYIAHTHTFQLHEQILKLCCYINNADFDQSSGNSFPGHEPKIWPTVLSNQNPPHRKHGRSGHFDLQLRRLAWLDRFQLRLTLWLHMSSD